MTQSTIGVTSTASVVFDPARPDVGIADGSLTLKGSASEYRVPFSLQLSDNVIPTAEQIHLAVSNALSKEGWNVTVHSVQLMTR